MNLPARSFPWKRRGLGALVGFPTSPGRGVVFLPC